MSSSEATEYVYRVTIAKVTTLAVQALSFRYHNADTKLVTSHTPEAGYVS